MLAWSQASEKPSGTERNNCHCELSRPFMGRIKVNEKLYFSPTIKQEQCWQINHTKRWI